MCNSALKVSGREHLHLQVQVFIRWLVEDG